MATTIEVYNLENKKMSEMQIDAAVSDLKVKPGLIHEAVQMQLANRRQGTASTKTRGEVRGGGKKPWKQKGTGRARVGSSRSPLWKGGGTVFGPRPRKYTKGFPKQKGQLALAGAVSAKLKDGEVKVLEAFSLSQPKTREIANTMSRLDLNGRVLLVLAQPDESIRRATRNHPLVTLVDLDGLNVYDLLLHQHLLITKQDLETLQVRLVAKRKKKISSRGAK